ncbi:MAG: hypothetical protein NT037_06545 [Hyphomicrobiales bacterium]|nr:hypothetical protein [Hyphomicrobiales bacterium]
MRSAWHFGFASVHLLDPNGQHVAGWEFGQPAGAAGFQQRHAFIAHRLSATMRGVEQQSPATELASPGHERSLGHAGLIHTGFELTVAVVSPASPAPGRLPGFVIALKSLDSATLADIGNRNGPGQIAVKSGARVCQPLPFP